MIKIVNSSQYSMKRNDTILIWNERPIMDYLYWKHSNIFNYSLPNSLLLTTNYNRTKLIKQKTILYIICTFK